MHGLLSGVRGPFTPSQWMELEHQALIYKYIIANVPIPSYLLNPIRKALESTCFSSFSGLRPNACEFLYYFNVVYLLFSVEIALMFAKVDLVFNEAKYLLCKRNCTS